LGRLWVHAALAVTSRFLLDVRIGPRTLQTAIPLVATVALCCTVRLPLLLIDDHLPYPSAILEVFGCIGHRRRRRGHGRKKYPMLKAPAGLWVGVVRKVRDASGHLLGVTTRALFGPRRQIRARIQELGIGNDINTSHLERLNGTIRGQQSRLKRRTRSPSRREIALQHSLWLWRDVYNWTRPHGSLQGKTPAMAQGLTDQRWTVQEYVYHPVHASDLQRAIWAEEREKVSTSALAGKKHRKILPKT
jgi:transposase InsO family protein